MSDHLEHLAYEAAMTLEELKAVSRISKPKVLACPCGGHTVRWTAPKDGVLRCLGCGREGNDSTWLVEAKK